MRSPTTAGEECPGDRAVFQITLVVGPISAGRRVSSAARPELLGPRNWGQSEARLGEARGRAARRPSPNSLAIFISALRHDGSAGRHAAAARPAERVMRRTWVGG